MSTRWMETGGRSAWTTGAVSKDRMEDTTGERRENRKEDRRGFTIEGQEAGQYRGQVQPFFEGQSDFLVLNPFKSSK